MAPSQPPPLPSLVVTGGRLNGRYVLMTGETGEHVIGSAPLSHFQLESGNVEPTHAKVRWNAQGVFLEDLSRERGTFVNGERFQESCGLGDGDRVWLGPPGDHESVRITVMLPGHPKDYSAEDAVSAAEPEPKEPEPQWGALDDEENVIQAEVAHPAGTRSPAPAAARPATAHAPAAPARVPVAGRRAAARPPVPRAILVGVGAAVLAIGGFFFYSRSQAPGPVLVSLLPPKAEPGQTVQITGSGFEAKPEDNAVTFGDKPAEIISATPTQLSVNVPKGLPADDKPQHRVRVRARGTASNTLFFRVYVGPRVEAFEPDVAMPGDVVKATGDFFGEDTTITVGGTAAEVLEVQPKELRFRVPKLSVSSGKALSVGVQVSGNSARAATLLIGKLPLIMEVAPARGVPGERVTVKGRGFDPAPGGSAVTIGGRPALVLAASERELQVVVPGGGRLIGQSDGEISVRARGATSAVPAPFQVTRVSTAVFVPRFFPEPGPDPETVYVSTDVGPFLRLRGKADAPSAAERGARAAAALNGLMEQALRGPVAVEVREKPQLGIAVGGAPALLVAALPEDGRAYDGAPSARALARFWSALLQDYATLFAQKQRPIRVVELQPRGQALLELYAAAERRAGVGSGVPPAVLENLTPSQARALAEVALSVPGESQAASGAAVAGRWEGTLEETGQAVRAIQVRIRTNPGGGLLGGLTTSAGAIAGELPLQDASYAAGSLRFSLKMGAAPLHFDGKVDGRNVAGELRSADGKPRGRFTLRWVE